MPTAITHQQLNWFSPLNDTPGGTLTGATLQTSINARGGAEATIILEAGTWTIGSNLEIPANIHLWVATGAFLSVGAGVTLTITGSMTAAQRHIFTGAGSVVFGGGVGDVHPVWFGILANDLTDNQSAINRMLNAVATNGGTIHWPIGVVRTSGNHAVAASINMRGHGMQKSIIRLTGTTVPLFTMLSAGEVTVERGDQRYSELTLDGPGSTTTATAFEIKNKSGIVFDHIEVMDFEYGWKGRRDNVANSVNNVNWDECRVINTRIGVYGPRQWNVCNVHGGNWNSTYWNFIFYDSSGLSFIGTSSNFSGTDAGGGGIFLGGCDGFSINPLYCEGDPAVEGFVKVTANKDVAGATTLNGIALNQGRGGFFGGLRCSSAGVTSYGLILDGVSGVAVLGGNAGSGITGALVRVLSGTSRNVFIGLRSNPGVDVSFENAADKRTNFWVDVERGGGVDVPEIYAARVLELLQGIGASEVSKAVLGNAAAGAPADPAGAGLVVYATGDSLHLYLDGARDNDDAAINLNFRGYQGGTTRFRDVNIYDGKGALILTIDASAGLVSCVADLRALARLKIPVIATASLPAAGAAEDGRVLIEDAGAGDKNLIIYASSQRWRIDGGVNF